MPPLVVCVVLNTNRRDDTLACVASLQSSDYQNRRVIVLDCQSNDGSVAAIRSAFPAVTVIALSQNLGYAGNNNTGIRAALAMGADWVFLLNEDTIVSPTCLSRLVEVGTSNRRTGIVGPTVFHHDEPTIIQSAGGGLSRWWEGFHYGQNEPDRGQFTEPRPVDWISGCGILVRRAVIESAGLIDERFFIYWEETEWCMRASAVGWNIVHVPDAHIWHKGVQRDYRPRASVTYYSTRNRLLMLKTHEAPMAAWIVAWAQIFRTIVSWSVRPKWRSRREHRDAMWRAVADFWRRRLGAMPS